MQNLFSPDSRFMAAAGRAADLMILNLMFLLACVPVITIGPACTAMYSVVFAMGTGREKGAAGSFVGAFRQNFLPALKAWLVILWVGAALGADVFLFFYISGLLSVLLIPVLILAVVGALAAVYVFPLISFFENSTRGTLRSALVLSLGNLPRSAAILAIQVFPWAVLIFSPWVFFNAAFLWIAVYFSAAAYISSLILRKVLAPYLPEDVFDEEQEETA